MLSFISFKDKIVEHSAESYLYLHCSPIVLRRLFTYLYRFHHVTHLKIDEAIVNVLKLTLPREKNEWWYNNSHDELFTLAGIRYACIHFCLGFSNEKSLYEDNYLGVLDGHYALDYTRALTACQHEDALKLAECFWENYTVA